MSWYFSQIKNHIMKADLRLTQQSCKRISLEAMQLFKFLVPDKDVSIKDKK